MNDISDLKEKLNTTFDMKDLVKVRKILLMIIERNKSNNSLKVQEKHYLEKLVSKFGDLIPISPHFVLNKA